MKRKLIISSIISLLISVSLISQTRRGTPNQLRVNVDALGYLVVSSAAQTLPITQVQFSNARLAVDANNNLLIAASSGSGFAPADATYITKTANATLTAEQALSTLSTGLMNVTTTTGAVTSIADVAANQVLTSGTPAAYSASPRLTALGLGAAAPGNIGLAITGGTLANDAQAILANSTMGSVPTATFSMHQFTTTGAGSASQILNNITSTLSAGYTGSSNTHAIFASNLTAGASSGVNFGFNSNSTGAGASARNVGISGIGQSAGTNIGVYGNADGTSASTLTFPGGVTAIGLAASNGTSTGDILTAFDGATRVASIQNDGNLLFTGLAANSTTTLTLNTSGKGAVDLVANGNTSIIFGSSNNVPVVFKANGTSYWTLGTAGSLTAVTDNSYDIGASAATRPRTVYVGTSVVVPAVNLGTNLGISSTLPTFTSGFGGVTSRTITGTAHSFSIVVGSSSTDNNGVLGLPTAANGWVCHATNQTSPGATDIKQSASTTSAATLTQYNTTLGTAANFAAADVVKGNCEPN